MVTMRPKPVSQSQWIFPESSLSHTPSRREGMPLEEELKKRKDAVAVMRSLAYRTQLVRQDDKNVSAAKGIMLVGATLIHRFYMRRSIQDFSPPLIGATVFFLTSKIEEEPVKLRYIVNACLSKFEGIQDTRYHWDPHGRPDVGPTERYLKWENNILSTEEIVLEALCFDMAVPQPWVIFETSLRDLPGFLLEPAKPSTGPPDPLSSTDALVEIGWSLLSESSTTPLAVLFYPEIIAYVVFVVLVARLGDVPLSEAKRTAAEVGWKFGLNLDVAEDDLIVGTDLQAVEDCLSKVDKYCRLDLLERDLLSLIPPDPANGSTSNHKRRFKPNPHPQPPTESNGTRAASAGAIIETPPLDPLDVDMGGPISGDEKEEPRGGSISPPRY